MTDILFLAIAGIGLVALAAVLLAIGRLAADCPVTGGAARLSTLVVTTAFIAIGTGAIALTGAALPLFSTGGATGLYLAIGVAAIALGIGFTMAAARLRDLLDAVRAARPAEPAADQPAE